MEEPDSFVQSAGTILLAATPIGDVEDASPRFRLALKQADVIAAEDTRRLLALAGRLGVHVNADVLSLHDHNEDSRASRVVDQARSGQRVMVVSDAGMPTVSDPGFRVVRAAIQAGVAVSALPGPSAPVTALAVSGLPSDRFSFEGFLPRKPGQALTYLQDLAFDGHTLIFFESAKRVHDTLERMAQVFGPQREAVVCRELTKIHQEIMRGTLADLVSRTAGTVLGEITIVVAPATSRDHADNYVDQVLELADGGMKLKDAAAFVAKHNGVRKNELYQAAISRQVPNPS